MTFSKKRQGRTKVQLNEYERFVAADLVNPEDITVTFDDIGGLESIKQELRETVILQMKQPELFQRGLLKNTNKGVLFYGPPGTGKTLIAKALAGLAEAAFININVASVVCYFFFFILIIL